ncbi:PLP-dependent aminotransferase family protein [Conexibacter sp. SYSU D00693]|uniref:aminotransferase-like domain-containing protein n=1 Tax=Conexibacter sp. SYSU D00693 TaxID=2812560 RepID=UPI00196AB0E5|nr:PLP-dependent aminotransferase family protein [Conexibacter sp. SYSU D00693]
MSYKVDLSDIDRAGKASLTAQIADRIAADIELGVLGPGEKLPTTRVLAEHAGINHLTAARIYRRLADQGYVAGQVGRGTFVRSHPPVDAQEAGDDAEWQSSVLRPRRSTYAEQMLAESLGTGRDVIPFAAGFPAPSLLPAQELAALAEGRLRDGSGLEYLPVEGLPSLRVRLAELGRELGFASEAEEVVVTTGGRQAIDLVARAVLGPGDVAVVESPTFAGTLTSLQATGAQVLAMPVDDEGADVAVLERILARHEVKLVAVQPACQNPTGVDLSEARRARLVHLARERGFFVLEDGVYGSMALDGRDRPRLRAQAPAHVVYVDSLSKSIGGGLRLGWIAASGPVLPRLVRLKMDADLHSAALPQHLAAAWLEGDRHQRHLEAVIPEYRRRRDELLEALERHLGAEATWAVPTGGQHVWVTLRRAVDERALYAEALRAGVSFLPGGATQAEPTARTSLRLSFSYLDPSDFDEGVKRLARALASVRRRQPVGATAPLS